MHAPPPETLDRLFEAVRESCSREVWSRGVELARARRVLRPPGEAPDAGGALRLVVAAPGRPVPPVVELHPDEEDWSCDCGAPDDPCVHTAAAVIALRRGLPDARGRASGTRARRVRYQLARAGRTLALERELVSEGGEDPVRLRSSLSAVLSGRVPGPPVLPTDRDLEIDRVLGTRARGPLPPGVLRRVVELLDGSDAVRLDGVPLRVSAEEVRPRVVVEDREGDFLVRLLPPAEGGERFDGGVLLADGVLRPTARETGLLGAELERLTRGERVAAGDVARLVGELLPRLEGRVDLEVRTRRLPRAESLAPRVVIETERRGGQLSVLPLLVYGDPPRARIDGGRLVHLRGAVPLRHEEAERRLRDRLERELGLVPGRRVELPPREATGFLERLGRASFEIRGDGREAFRALPALEPKLRIEGDTLDLHFESCAGSDSERGTPPRRASAAAVLDAFERGERALLLPGGGVAPLPESWLRRHADRIRALLEARDRAGRVRPAALPALAELCEEHGVPPPPGAGRVQEALERAAAASEPELPPDLCATLRPYQRRAVAWLAALRDAGLGALLADDMGLGKTLEALCALGPGRHLVVCPTSVLPGWREQAERFRPGLRVSIYHGPSRELPSGDALVLTTWALLRRDAERLAGETWDTVILDEAQAIKNPDSGVARAAFRLEARFRVALTGTPVENRLEELWSQMHFANPGLLGSRRHFRERFARPATDGEGPAWKELRRRIRPFVLRRRKEEVAPELPPRIEQVLYCELDPEERALYDAVHAATRREVVRRLAAGGRVVEALEALLRLRQAACHAGLVPGAPPALAARPSSKLALLREALETAVAEGHHALVFSQWTSLLDRIEPVLRGAGIEALRLDGATRDREAVVSAFQAEDGPPVLLVSLRAGGTGLNLTRADHVFLLDPWWNPAVEDQAADRAHRIGQDRPVVLHRLVSAGTVEEGILALQRRKRELAESALGAAGDPGGLRREEILELLG